MKKLLFTATLFLTPCILFAHGAGEEIQKEHNEYLLSVGSADEFVYAGEAGRINFEIETKGGVAFEDWTGVWVRMMSPSGEPLFAGTIERGGDGLIAGMSYTFPEPGAYDITLRFADREKVIAESEFEFSVKEARKTAGVQFPQRMISMLAVLVVGAFLGFVLNNRFFGKKA